MRRKKRLLIGMITAAICISLLLAGCGTKKKETPIFKTAVSQIDMEANGHTEQMHDYDSPYTLCYRNEDDTFTMYIFASPVQYQTDTGYAIIDNTVVQTEKEGFAYENKANKIKTYFPKTLKEYCLIENDTARLEWKPGWDTQTFTEGKETIYTNMYGDQVSAVIYEREDMDVVLYPTKAGIKTELVLKEKPMENTFDFCVRSAAGFENRENGYITLNWNGENESVLYGPLVGYEAGEKHLDVTGQMEIMQGENANIVTVTVDDKIFADEATEYPVRLDPSLELYLSKMPDSTAYSAHSVNNYLANYAVVGEHPAFGEGWHFLRFRLNWFIHLDGASVQKAVYYIRNLYSSSNSSAVQMMDLNTQWTSTGLRWGNRPEVYSMYMEYETKSEQYVPLEITDFVKKSLDDESWMEESHGLLLKGKNADAYTIFATSDHSLYAPYLRLDLTDLPADFVPQDNINPPAK